MSHCNCNHTNTFAEFDQYQTNYHDYLQPYSAYPEKPPCGCMSGQSIGCGCSQSGHCNHCRGVQVIGIMTLPASTTAETPPSPSPPTPSPSPPPPPPPTPAPTPTPSPPPAPSPPPSPSPPPPTTPTPPQTPAPTSESSQASDSSQVTAVTTRLVRNPIFWGGIVVAILLLLIIVFMNR